MSAGNDRLRAGDYDGAIADFTEAVQLNSRNPEACLHRGIAYAQQGSLRAAIADFTRALEIDPSLAEAHANLGGAWCNLGRYDLAIASCTEALRIDPTLFEAYHNRAYALYLSGRPSLAVDDYTRALELRPGNADTHFERGCALYDLAEWDRSLADFRQAWQREPGRQEYALIRLALVSLRLGERPPELPRFLAASGRSDWPFLLARFLADDLPEAVLRDAASSKEDRCELGFYAGTRLLIEGERQAALASLRESVATGLVGLLEYHSARAELKRLS